VEILRREKEEGRMKMVWITACLTGLLACTSAHSESTKDALQEFGLLGTWSDDCSKDLTREAGQRETYAAPIIGAPTVVMKTGDSKGVAAETMEISRAVRITDDKIEMTFDGDLMKGARMVYQKVGSKIRLLKTYAVPGATQVLVKDGMIGNLPTLLLERCLN
jgi:hypothetical protein